MVEPEQSGKRMPAKGTSEATERQPQRTTQTTAPAAPRPAPKPAAAPKPKAAPGVPMAGQSYAQRQADAARRAKVEASAQPAPAPRPTPPTRPPAPKAAELDLDLDETFDLGDEYEDEPAQAAPAPVTTNTPSKIYSTRRALAEQVNEDVGVAPSESDAKGIDAIRDKREAWKKTVAAKEDEGKSPYVSRWAKVSFFPMLYFLVSLSLLRKIRYEYADYYDYDSIYLMLGMIVGFIFLVLATTGTMLRAKRVKKPIQLKGRATWIGVIVFIGISFYLAYFEGLAYAWMFSIGFLATGLIIVAIGFALEKSGKGTFWVKDPMDGSDKRWLEYVPMSEA
jgi:hypothetical protein